MFCRCLRIAILVVVLSTVTATGNQWTGVQNNLWSNANNWYELRTPPAGDTVSIITPFQDFPHPAFVVLDTDTPPLSSVLISDRFATSGLSQSAFTMSAQTIGVGNDSGGGSYAQNG